MQKKTKRQLTLLLAALTLVAPQIGAIVPSLQNTPLAVATAEAQTYKRGRDYRDSDLNRMAWITQRGKVTSNPREDYLEMRTDDGQNLRVVTRANVSLRGIKRDDRIEIYGKRDGAIVIAYNVKEIGGSSGNGSWNNNERVLQGVVISLSDSKHFKLRSEDGRDINVIVDDGAPIRVSSGDRVILDGRWNTSGRWNNSSIFRASSARVTGSSSVNKNERILQGIVLSDNDARRFTMRTSDGRDVTVISDERTPRRLSRGDTVFVEGRWDWNQIGVKRDNVFRATSLRVVRNNDTSNNNERTLQGTVLSDNDMRRFTMRTNDRRDVTVVSSERNPRRLSRGDTVVVEGRWDWNQIGNKRDNIFRATSVRVVRDNTSSGHNFTKVDFRGTIMRASQSRNTWDYIVRSDGQDYRVNSREKHRIGDRVRVRGTLFNGTVVAADIDKY